MHEKYLMQTYFYLCLSDFSYPWKTTIHMETWWTRTSLEGHQLRILPCTCPPMCLLRRGRGPWPPCPCRTRPRWGYTECPPRVTLRTATECPPKESPLSIMGPTCHPPWGIWWWVPPPTAPLRWVTAPSTLTSAPNTWCRPHPDKSSPSPPGPRYWDSWWWEIVLHWPNCSLMF